MREELKNKIRQEREKSNIVMGGVDLPFFTLVIIILIIGLLMLFSASTAYAYEHFNGDSFHFIKRQAVFAVIGVAIMMGVSFIPYKLFNNKFMAFLPLAITGVLLTVVLIMGAAAKGAQRWIDLGPFSIQPSEVAKVSIIIAFAYMISKSKGKINQPKNLLPMLFLLGITCGMIMLQKHLSGTLLVAAIGIVMLFVGGLNYTVSAIAVIGTSFVIYLVAFTNFIGSVGKLFGLKDYQMTRIETWKDPTKYALTSGFQVIQSLYAIGSGGIMGLGLGNSRQKNLYIPEPQNDFIFAIICEELGFIGAMIIILLFMLLIWRGILIALRSTDKFASMIVIGIVSMVAIQVILNIAVVTNAIPTTGISMPFFSYGGSSLFVLMAAMGMVLNISRYSYQNRA